MPPLFAAIVGSFVRFGLAALATWLVSQGVWTQAAASDYVAGLTLGVVSLAWSIWQKYRGRLQFLTALEAPAGTTEEAVKQALR